jgi:succinate dehydrogenase flavin-adding protein (antitoxin of CptAB toxin-antitoxin module)
MNSVFNQLKWRSKRSMLELDLLLYAFVNSKYFNKLSNIECAAYADLLKLPDQDLLLVMHNRYTLCAEHVRNIVTTIKHVIGKTS